MNRKIFNHDVDSLGELCEGQGSLLRTSSSISNVIGRFIQPAFGKWNEMVNREFRCNEDSTAKLTGKFVPPKYDQSHLLGDLSSAYTRCVGKSISQLRITVHRCY